MDEANGTGKAYSDAGLDDGCDDDRDDSHCVGRDASIPPTLRSPAVAVLPTAAANAA